MATYTKTRVQKQGKKVSFSITAPDAKSVMLAGDFNNWNEANTPLKRTKNNVWMRDLVLNPGRYEYKFIVDGNWITDSANNNTAWNALGVENSVIEVKK